MKRLKLIFFLALLVVCPPVFAEDYDTQVSLTFDVIGQAALPPGGLSSTTGLGGSFFADWRPLPVLSIGTGVDFTNYFGTPAWQTGSWNIGGRIFPVPSDKGGEIYLQGTAGVGFASLRGSYVKTWPGNFHGDLGVGYRFFVGPIGALDVGAQYDFFSPIANRLSAVGLKLGWVFLFGNSPIHDRDKQ